MALRQDLSVVTGVSLRRPHMADAAVAMVEVVPVPKVASPMARIVQGRKVFGWKLGAVLGCAEQAFNEGVVIAHPMSRVQGLDAQPVQHGDGGGGLDGHAVVVFC